jgi:hypothetical protein
MTSRLVLLIFGNKTLQACVYTLHHSSKFEYFQGFSNNIIKAKAVTDFPTPVSVSKKF